MRHRRTLLWISLVLWLVATAADAQSDPELDIAIAHLQSAYSKIDSIEFKWTSETKYSPESVKRLGAARDTHVVRCRYAEASGRFRIEGELTDIRSGAPIEMTALFDGQRYQKFNPGSGYLIGSSRPISTSPAPVSIPLLWPFEFAFEQETMKVTSTLRDPEFWDSLRKRARWKGTQLHDGREFAVLELDVEQFGQKLLRTAYLARDMGYSPVQWEMRSADGKLMTLVKTVTAQPFSVGGSELSIPTRIETQVYDRDGNLSQSAESSLEVASLVLNQPIAEERFTIASTQAREYFDADTGTTYVNADPRGDTQAAVLPTPQFPRRRWSGWWIGGGLAAAAILLGTALWWVAQRRKEA